MKQTSKSKHDSEIEQNCDKKMESPQEEQDGVDAKAVADSTDIGATSEVEQLKERLLRQMAEFDNYKKRTGKEKNELYSRAKAETVEEMLPILDNFERALQTHAEGCDETFVRGIEMIFTQLTGVMTKLGVEEIVAEGMPFDPDLHHAVQQVEDPEQESNTVCEVLQKGYRLGDRVIRHAMVVVANP